MANILSSKLVTLTFPALAFILSLCVGPSKTDISCSNNDHCGDIDHKGCIDGKCCECDNGLFYGNGRCFIKGYNDKEVGDGRISTVGNNKPIIGTNQQNTDFVNQPSKPNAISNQNIKNVASTYGIAIVFLLVVIGGGVAACCFFISGCPGHKWRKRNEPPEPPAQPNMYPNPAQYPSQPQFAPPNPDGSNASVPGVNGPPQYPYPYQQQPQPQYPYPNMNPNYGQGQYPNPYGAPPPPPNYSQYPNQYPAPPPFPPPPPPPK